MTKILKDFSHRRAKESVFRHARYKAKMEKRNIFCPWWKKHHSHLVTLFFSNSVSLFVFHPSASPQDEIKTLFEKINVPGTKIL